MMQKNRFIPILLMVSILLTTCQGFVAAAEEQDGSLPQVLFKYTGDDPGDTSITSTSGDVSIVKDDDEHGKVLSIGEGSTIFVNLGKELSAGRAVISWDAKADLFNESYLRIYGASGSSIPGDSGKMFDTLIYRTDGRIQPFKELFGWVPDTTQVSYYQKEKWHHVDLWLDIDKRVLDYYIDGQKKATINITDKFEKFCSFSMTHVKKSIGADLRFDNFAVGYVPEKGHKTGFDFCEYIPPEIEAPVFTELLIDDIGHAFFDENVLIKASMANALKVGKNLELNFKVYTESGRLVYEKTADSAIAAEEVLVKEYSFTVDEFGYYNAYIEVKDKDTGEVFGDSVRFSHIHGPEDGVVNKKIGLNNHLYDGMGSNRYADFVKMQAKAGFGYNREKINWDWVEKPAGTYTMPEIHQKYIPEMSSYGMNQYAIVGTRCWLYNGEEEVVPVSDSEVSHWRDYVENLARICKDYGIERFEIGNELNLRFNSDLLTAEQYTRLLKEAYPTIKKVNPNAKVYAFATAAVKSEEFIRGCLEAGAGAYLDGIAIHNYDVHNRPEGSTYYDEIDSTRALMEEFGIEDKELVISEMGWTSAKGYADEEQQARYSVRLAALLEDVVDLCIYYLSIEKVDSSTESEFHFGLVRGWRGQEVNFEAKPAFLGLSNYNALVAEAKKTEEMKILDDEGYICKFKDKDGSDIFMVWKQEGEAELTLDVGAENVVMYDMFGNDTKLKTNNGALQISVDEYPVYLTGVFTKCDEVKNSKQIKTAESIIEATKNDSAAINVSGGKPTYKLEVELPENIELVENKGFVDGKAKIKLKTGASPAADEKIKVIVKDKADAVIYVKELSVEYKAAVTYDFSVKYYRSGRWQGVIKLTNNNNDSPITGTFTAKEPSSLARYVRTRPIDKIGAKQTGIFEFNIPIALTGKELTLSGMLKLSNGEEIEIEETTYFTSLMPVSKSPTIDGKIELGEYNTKAPVKIDKADMVQELVADWWDGKNDASATMYINYDKDYFYLAAIAEDDILGDNDPEGRIWANDSIQFAFANSNTSGEKITEIGIGLVNGKPEITRYSFMGDKENIMFLDPLEKEGFNNDLELQIVREGTKTIYELKVPWVDIYASDDDFNRKNIYFSTILNDNDGVERLGWIEFCPGIGSAKNASLFSKVAVEKK